MTKPSRRLRKAERPPKLPSGFVGKGDDALETTIEKIRREITLAKNKERVLENRRLLAERARIAEAEAEKWVEEFAANLKTRQKALDKAIDDRQLLIELLGRKLKTETSVEGRVGVEKEIADLEADLEELESVDDRRLLIELLRGELETETSVQGRVGIERQIEDLQDGLEKLYDSLTGKNK